MFVCCAKNCKCQHDSKADCIGCWLCDKFIHVKCAGFTIKVKDSIVNNTGLKWSCESCRDAEADMSKFIRQTRENFSSLRKSFLKLHDDFQAAEMQFNALKVLDVSPKPSLTPNKAVSPLSPCSTFCYTPIKDPNALIASSSLFPTIVVNDDDAGPSSNINPLPAPSLPVPITNPLVAVPLRKQIFISRLHPDTSIDDVKAYVQLKIPNAPITIDKFKFSYTRDISSFKLNVPPELFTTICCNKFWPNDLVVKEFTSHKRSKPNVSVPVNLSTVNPTNISKN